MDVVTSVPPASQWSQTFEKNSQRQLKSRHLAPAAMNSGFHELHIESNGDFITDQDAAGFKRGVPGQAKVLAVDLVVAEKPAGVAPGVLAGRGRPFDPEDTPAGHTVNRQIAGDLQFAVALLDLGRLKVSVGNFSTSKKSAHLRWASRWASRVLMVAASIDGFQLGRDEVGFVQGKDAGEAVNLPFDVGDHHVLYLKFGDGVGRVDLPGGGGPVPTVEVLILGDLSVWRVSCYTDNRLNEESPRKKSSQPAAAGGQQFA